MIDAANVIKPLPGHTSPETAYVVDDYPYGFRLRCKIRYWIEKGSGAKGFRFCSQTTNPKIEGHEVWNAPKKSTFVRFAAGMYLDKEGHVSWGGVSEYGKAADALAFVKALPGFDYSALLEWSALKAEFCRKLATGEAHFVWKINGGPEQKAKREEGENERDLAESKAWLEVHALLTEQAQAPVSVKKPAYRLLDAEEDPGLLRYGPPISLPSKG